MGNITANLVRGLYAVLLFAPGGFYILGFVLLFKAIKSGNFAQFKQEIKQMIKPADSMDSY